MARPAKLTLTDRESEIMEILWGLESATSEQIRQRLGGQPHDSTVRTLLRILRTKKYVKIDSNQRPAIYRPAIPRVKAQKKAVTNLLQQLFGGSAESLVVRLLEDKQLSLDQLDELRETLIQSQKKDGEKS